MKKYTEEEVFLAIQRYNNGETIKNIAKDTNRSASRLAQKMKLYGCNIIPINKVKHFNENAFDSIDSSEKAYWLGFLFADGNIGSSDNSISINLQKQDKEHLEKFNKFLQYDNNNIKVYKNKNNIEYCHFYCKNAHMHNILNNLGCIPKKSKTMKFPEIIKNSEFFWDFIRGYFDGDGCITYDFRSEYREPRCSISCGSKDFIYSLSEQLNAKGYPNKVVNRKNIYILYIGNYKWNTNAKFMIKLYNNSSIYLQRKYNKYLNYRGRLAE